ncbi:response regulator [Thermoleptolyngbya sp. C42_A2020_037]|uniref:response regulator n=1 Tax=Thermoleptolyngbya sp. C42_A2020_037 TaxID=2747799 RepID=UPI0019E5636E|nr:response regulator [Thermoleptolyngbya sp. C42_A2020_037]MBF2084685.1 response regulator [Thermoleptolyngbya sp. C42_A2020_037]
MGVLNSRLGRKLPLQSLLVVPFLLQLAGTTALIGYLSYRNSQRAVNHLALELRNELTARIQQEVSTYVQSPFVINDLNAIALRQGDLDPSQQRGEYLFWTQARSLPANNLIYCAVEDGSFMGVGRTQDGANLQVILSKAGPTGYFRYYDLSETGDRSNQFRPLNRPYDPRIRPWYQKARQEKKPVWSDIYLDFDAQVPVLTASKPVYEDGPGRLLGVCATDFIPSLELNRFLSNLKVGKTGETFILARTGELIASSTADEESLLLRAGEDAQLLPARDSQNPLVNATADYLYERFEDLRQIDQVQQLEFRLPGGDRQFAQVSPFRDEYGLDWLIVVAVPESDFMAEINANNRLTRWLSLGALALAAGIGVLTSRWIARPILKLNQAAQAIAEGDLAQTVEVSGIAELETLAQSFNQMGHQLQDSFDTLEQRVQERTAELAESNRQLELAKEKAEVANEAKSTFIANMSHELRSPLNAVLGFSQLALRSHSLPPDQRENVGIIYRSGEYLLTLINNILDISKIEAGKTTLHLKSFNLHRLLSDLEDMLYLRAESKNLLLTVIRSDDLPQYIQADEVKLRQVLINLLSNGIKFTQTGSVSLHVSTQPPSPTPLVLPAQTLPAATLPIYFEVRDTGIGIAPKELPHLFEAFTQTQAGKESQEGTGLGLAISRKFIQLMGGDIAVSSEVGVGTAIAFYIQASLSEAAPLDLQPARRRVLGLAPGQPTYRILVVDDKEVNRRLLVKLLSPLGFEVREASNGLECIEIWDDWEPHLIWMDMRMPVMDGYEATQRIKATTKGQATAVIALTASVLEEEKVVILSAGCDDFLRKPFHEQSIFDAIAKHLGVVFLYEESESVSREQEPPTDLHSPDLQDLPDAWKSALYTAALEADSAQVEALIAQVSVTHAALAQDLSQWSHQFRFDKILEWVEALPGSTAPIPDAEQL